MIIGSVTSSYRRLRYIGGEAGAGTGTPWNRGNISWLFLAPLVWSIYLLNEGATSKRVVFGVGAVTVAGICLGSLGLVITNLLSLNPEIYGSPFLGTQFIGFLLWAFWLGAERRMLTQSTSVQAEW